MAIIINPITVVRKNECLIRIKSITGATLTCGSQTYTLGASETSHIFTVSAGTYTCTATKSGYNINTKSITVSSGLVTETINPLGIYQEVEYLQGTGEQYIVVPSSSFLSTDTIEIKVVDPGRTYILMGYSTTYRNDAWIQSNGYIKWGYSGSSYSFANSGTVWKIQGNKFYIDGVLKATGPQRTWSPSSLTLFAAYSGLEKGSMKCYYCTVSRDGTNLINLIPCYRTADSKPGMYDTVNDVFYTNEGIGADFTVGPDV